EPLARPPRPSHLRMRTIQTCPLARSFNGQDGNTIESVNSRHCGESGSWFWTAAQASANVHPIVGLTAHVWTVQELLMTVVSPTAGKMKEGDYPLSLAIRIVA